MSRYLFLLLLLVLGACSKQAPPPTEPVIQTCADLAQGCSLNAPGGAVKLQTDQPPSAMHKFRMTVTTPGAKQIRANLDMLDMDMGPNQYRLLPEGDHFYADMLLPMCVSGRSDWLLTLIIDGKPVKVQFTLAGKKG